jgi:predicted NBD/HSP70 family sugar kinase
MAESTFGAGRDVTELIYLNGGASGIGGGIIAGGAALGGAAGYAGELGHTLVNSSGSICHCGARGCLETEVRRERLLDRLGLADADADDLESALVASTDSAVLAEVLRQLDFLAVALRNAINTFNPQLIVLGGFLGALYEVAPAHLDALLAEQPLKASREGVRITRAELGSDLLMIGAGELAFAPLLADPAGFPLRAVSASRTEASASSIG